MIKIGQYNTLKITRFTDFGAYLKDESTGVEILLPARYLPEQPEVGQDMDVFVYTDSEDRLVATTERPLITVGTYAFLRVADVHPKVGAFLDWGLPKDLLCPYNEQRDRMSRDNIYLVYAYLDYNTKRVVASSKIEKFLGNTIPDYHSRDKVQALVYQRTDIGYKVIVDNLFAGMLYLDELIDHPEIGTVITAFVKKVREDGKIDVTLKDSNGERAHSIADKIMAMIERTPDGKINITDKSSPEEIAHTFGCSKKDFKKAVGFLYKNRRIALMSDGICKA